MQPTAEPRFHPDDLVTGICYEFKCMVRGHVVKEVGWFQHMDAPRKGLLVVYFTEENIPLDKLQESDLWELDVKRILSARVMV